MTESFLKMTENDRDRKWPLSQHQKTIPKAAFAIRCTNRKHLYLYTSATYALFSNILPEKACFLLRIFVSLHRQSKEQPSCAKSRSSMTTEAGLNRWQAPVINEDHKNGQETAFWGIVIQGTLKRRLSMINFKNFQNFKKRLQHYKQVGRVIPPPLPCNSRIPSPWLYQDQR